MAGLDGGAVWVHQQMTCVHVMAFCVRASSRASSRKLCLRIRAALSPQVLWVSEGSGAEDHRACLSDEPAAKNTCLFKSGTASSRTGPVGTRGLGCEGVSLERMIFAFRLCSPVCQHT